MSLFDLFRGFFGFHGERRPHDPFFGGFTRDDEEEEEEEDDEYGPAGFREGGAPEDFTFGFRMGPGDLQFHDNFGLEEFFRDFNSLFSGIGARSLPFEFSGMEMPPALADRSPEKGRSLRDSMLKYPDSFRPRTEEDLHPVLPERSPWSPFQGLPKTQWDAFDMKIFPNVEDEIDTPVASEGLEAISPPTQSRSYFKSISVTKTVAPDGTVEQRRTVRDSEGHEETVVTRQSREDSAVGFDSRQPRGPKEDSAPFGSGREQDMSDTASILRTFFPRWFPRQ